MKIPFQELESVDDCMDENSMLIWQSGAGSQHVASLAGQQHLLVVQQLGSIPPALCVRLVKFNKGFILMKS